MFGFSDPLPPLSAASRFVHKFEAFLDPFRVDVVSGWPLGIANWSGTDVGDDEKATQSHK